MEAWIRLLLLLITRLVTSIYGSSCDFCGPDARRSVCDACPHITRDTQYAWMDEQDTILYILYSGTTPEYTDTNRTCSIQAGLQGLICRARLYDTQEGKCCTLNQTSSKCEGNKCKTYKFHKGLPTNHTAIPYEAYFVSDVHVNVSTSPPPSVSQVSCSEKNCTHSSEGCKCKKKPMKKTIFIIGGASAGAVLLAVCMVLLLLRRYRLKQSRKYSSDRRQILIDTSGAVHNPTKVFTFKELKAATRSFSEARLLGGGGFSTVYHGKMPDGSHVAVKRLNQGNKQGIQQFQNEVKILSKVRHPNLVQLLGYCLEGRDLLLVYEYIINGTLADHLHGERSNSLPLETRLTVALETAYALAYLHFDVNPPIYHRDVKSSNILLDKDFHAKIADFGLSRLTHLDATHISTAPQGTPGYLDPDYHESYQLTDKSDVYSFGVVLLELVSRKKAIDMNREKKEVNLASMALARIHSGALHELFDPELSVKYWKVLTKLVEVAFRCLAPEKDDRPNMAEVVAELEQVCGLVRNLSSRRNGEKMKKQRSAVNNDSNVEHDSPTSVQVKWPSTHTSPNNSRSEAV